MKVKGIDVSKHQGVVDWGRVKASGNAFAIVRVGWTWHEGGLTIDERFAQNMAGAAAVGLPVGVYAYAYDRTPQAAKISAQAVLEAVRPYRLAYPIWYDQEYEKVLMALDTQTRTDICIAFCEAVQAHGYYAGLYASKDWLEHWLDDARLRAYDHWVAQYAPACSYQGAYGMWQHTGKGRCDGISGDVDCNFAYKDYPALIKAAGCNGWGEAQSATQTPSGCPLREEQGQCAACATLADHLTQALAAFNASRAAR